MARPLVRGFSYVVKESSKEHPDNTQESAAPSTPITHKRTKVQDDEVLPIVQFSTMIYYVKEDEGELRIDIVRLGPSEERSLVNYRTNLSLV